MTVSEQLKEYGLTKSESVIYLYLLEHGVSSPPEIARGTKIARPNTYHSIELLLDKGLIAKKKRGRRFVYVAYPPQTLLQTLERKKQVAEEMVGDLVALYAKSAHKPVVSFYEGKVGLETLFDETLRASEIRGVTSLEKLMPIAPEYFKKYERKLGKREVSFKDILTVSSKETAETSRKNIGPLYEYRFMKESFKEMPTDILIWDDTVSLLTLEAPIFATTVTDQNIADTFKKLFDFMWSALPRSS